MYAIRIDGQYADPMPDQTVRISRFNSLFNFDGVVGSVVNDFSLPHTPTNDRIFGFFSVPQMRFPNKKYYCELIADGYIFERGFIELINCTDTQYVVAFTQNLSEVFGAYQNVLLSKLPLGEIAYPAPVKAASHLTDDYCWPTVVNSAFYGTNVQSGFNGQINEWSGATLNAHARVPMLFFRWVFEQIASLTSFSFVGTFFESDEFKRAIAFNTFSVDDETNIYYANHLPDLTIPELLMNLRRLFNLALYFDVNTRTCTAHFGETLLNKPTKLDWTTKIVPNTSRRPERINRLQLDWELDGNDNLMKAIPLPTGFEKYAAPETQLGTIFEVKTRISTISTADGVAIIEQLGNTPRFNQGGQRFGARLAYWHGVDVSGVPVILPGYGSFNLAWSGTNNLAEKYWATYQRFRAKTAQKTVLANLNAADLQQINWHNNPNAEHTVVIKGKEYYIASVASPMPLQGVSELDLWEKP